MRGLLLGILLTGAWSAASAQTEVAPDWDKRPTGDQVAKYYPDEATDQSISGVTVIKCRVTLYGRAKDCLVVKESPAGMGFGEASLALADREFRFKPGRVDGKPADGMWIQIPLSFQSPSPTARYVITEAVWEQAPTFDDMRAAWPESAGDLAVGTSVLRCAVAPSGSGKLTNCTIAGQVPKGSPFGAAARTLIDKLRLKATPEEARKYAGADIAVSFRFYNPASPAGQAMKVEKPDWIVTIDPDKVVALYPSKAADAGVGEGVGVADCLVAPDGKMADCRVSREAPADMGFGLSAVAAVSVMQMDLWTPEGRPVAGARVKVPIKFSLAPEARVEAPAAP